MAARTRDGSTRPESGAARLTAAAPFNTVRRAQRIASQIAGFLGFRHGVSLAFMSRRMPGRIRLARDLTQALPLCLTAQRHSVLLTERGVSRDLADGQSSPCPWWEVRQKLIPENIFMSITFTGEYTHGPRDSSRYWICRTNYCSR